MRASAWLRLAALVGLLSLSGLLGALLIPVLARPPQEADAHNFNPFCLFLPAQADWAAHTASYLILGLLLVGGGRGLWNLLDQRRRTQQATQRLLTLSQPLDPALSALLAPLDLTAHVDLVASAVPVAFCYGLLRPRICLSTGLLAALPDDALQALLWHERYHLLRRDPVKVALGRAWAAGLFFLPLVGLLYRQYLVAKEVDADRYACSRQGSTGPLAEALVLLLDLQEPPLPGTAGAGEALEVRTAHLLGQPLPQRLPLRPVLVSILVVTGLLILTWLLAQLGVADPHWPLQHSLGGGC